MKSCFNFPDFQVVNEVMKKICKYHKRRGQEYNPNNMVGDFCSDAFYVAYPYCLALLYNAKTGDFKSGKITLCCPHPQGITFQVERVHCCILPIRIAKKIFTWIVGKLLYPVDWEDWHIKLTVTRSSDRCPAKFKVGDTYWFNIRRLDELCPASFYAVYPFILQRAFGIRLPWQEEESAATVHCPDHEGMIYTLKCGVNSEENKEHKHRER